MIPDSSTRDQKVTKPDFRPCSACMPHSQAPLCLCTLRLISTQPEGTFGRLRYLLGNCVRLVSGTLYRIASIDRKSTRLNSSHVKISYAVFCLKKKKNKI